MNGLSFLFVIGPYGGFHVKRSRGTLHICLAFFSLTVFLFDAEIAISNLTVAQKIASEKLSKWVENQGYDTNKGDVKDILDMLQ